MQRFMFTSALFCFLIFNWFVSLLSWFLLGVVCVCIYLCLCVCVCVRVCVHARTHAFSRLLLIPPPPFHKFILLYVHVILRAFILSFNLFFLSSFLHIVVQCCFNICTRSPAAGDGSANTKVSIRCAASSLPAVLTALEQQHITLDNAQCWELAKVSLAVSCVASVSHEACRPAVSGSVY